MTALPAGAQTFTDWTATEWLTAYDSTETWTRSGVGIDVDENGIANAVWVTPGGVNLSRSTDGGETWTPIYVASSTLDKSVRRAQIVSAGNNNWVAVWSVVLDDPPPFYFEKAEFHMARSTDGGQTWTPPVGILQGDYNTGLELKSDRDGTIMAAVVKGTYNDPFGYFSNGRYTDIIKSEDFGATWNLEPSPHFYPWSSYVFEYGSRITHHSGTWAMATSALAGNSSRDDLRYALSHDEGNTWTTGTIWAVGSSASWGRSYVEDILVTDNAIIVATRDRNYASDPTKILILRSTDNGATWANTHTLDVGQLAHRTARLEQNGNGDVLLTYGWRAPEDRISFIASADDGATWTTPKEILPTAERSDPSTAARPDNKFLVASALSALTPVTATTDNVMKAITLDDVNGAGTAVEHGAISDTTIYGLQLLNKDAVVSLGDGTHGLAVWNGGHPYNIYASVQYRQTSDGGKTWGPIQTLKDFFTPSGYSGNLQFLQLHYHGWQDWSVSWIVSMGMMEVSKSSDNGATWSTPQTVPARAMGHNGSGMMLAAANETDTDPLNTTIRMSTDAGATWTERATIPGAIDAKHLVHSKAGNWFLATSSNTYYASEDSGATWQSITPIYGTPPSDNRIIKTNHLGVLMSTWVAAIADFESTPPAFTRSVITQRSLDHGRTWHMTRMTDIDYPSTMLGFTTPPDVAWLGANRWVGVFAIPSAPANDNIIEMQWVETFDNGYTWQDENLITLNGQNWPATRKTNPVIAARAGNAVLIWQENQSANESELVYISNNYEAPVTSANDWTLYE